MYNIDYTIASLVILAFLIIHYVRVHRRDDTSGRFFAFYLGYVFLLSAVDILDVMFLGAPTMSVAACTAVCTVYLVLELLSTVILVLTVPVLVTDVHPREKRRWSAIFLPAVVVLFYLIFINPTTGGIFSISEAHYYVTGPASDLLVACNIFYIAVLTLIFIVERKHIERSKQFDVVVMILICFSGVILQGIFWDVRVTPLTATMVCTTIYLGFQIPEGRYDALTGLHNRFSFFEASHRLQQRHPSVEYIMVYANIEEFKAVNELYGVADGDHILLRLGRALNGIAMPDGVVGRLSGDHFAFCMPWSSFSLDKLLAATTGEALLDSPGRTLHVLFGIYVIDDKRAPVSIMVDRARLAMRTIEGSRVERCAFYDPDQGRQFLNDHELSSEMQVSVQEGNFEIYLQPLYDLQSFSITSAEALVRWNHPKRGMLSPGEFIPVFEHNGLITELDHFVWESTCRQLCKWRDQGLPYVPVSVNISAVDLEPDLGDYLVSLVSDFGIDPSYLKLEITESAYVARRDSLHEFIDFLHDQDFIVMMDDFGSGYSSLSALEETPFDQLKIDREFVAGITTDQRSRTVVDSTIKLAGQLGLHVVSEGVETLDQALMLRDMGSDSAQGFFFSKPVPVERFEEMLAGRPPKQPVASRLIMPN